ncbi:unnamed protein product [Sympodiomycopsis kandeliae]
MFKHTASLVTAIVAALTLLTPAEAGMIHHRRQVGNPSYANDPLSQTASLNFTSFVLPIKKTEAQKLVGNRNLLTPQGLPMGYLKEDEHPYVVTFGQLYDIRQAVLQIKELQLAQGLIPFVDATGDGKTPYNFGHISVQDQPVPVLAGNLQQQTALQQANFNPPDAPWRDIGDHRYALDINQGLQTLPNVPAIAGSTSPLGAPLPNIPTASAVWGPLSKGHSGGEKSVSTKFFKGVAMAPYIQTYNGLCSKTKMDYDNLYSQEFKVKGQVSTYPPFTDLAEKFNDVYGYHAVTGWDNEFGPGKPCEQYKAFAAGVKYQ